MQVVVTVSLTAAATHTSSRMTLAPLLQYCRGSLSQQSTSAFNHAFENARFAKESEGERGFVARIESYLKAERVRETDGEQVFRAAYWPSCARCRAQYRGPQHAGLAAQSLSVHADRTRTKECVS